MRYPNTAAASPAARHMVVTITDISAAEATVWLPAAFQCRLKDLYCVIDGAIDTADATLTASHDGVTLGKIVVPFSGSAAGAVAFGECIGPRHTIPADGAILIQSDGASTNTVRANVTLVLEAA